MGYYSDVWVEIEGGTKVNSECIERLKNELDNWDIFTGWQNANIEYDEDGTLKSITTQDGILNGKFYDSEVFGEYLSKCLVNGKVIFEYNGEDGCRWRVVVTPDKSIVQDGNVCYGATVSESFIEEAESRGNYTAIMKDLHTLLNRLNEIPEVRNDLLKMFDAIKKGDSN